MKKIITSKFCLFAVATILFSSIATGVFGQAKITVTGTVKSVKGEALTGVTVTQLNTNNSAQTDAEGKYSTTVPKNAILSFTYVGYKSVAQSVNGRTTIDVSLAEESKELDQVIIIGYGSVKKKDLTGSVSSVKSEEIVQTSPLSVEQALQGRAAGVQVTSTDGSPGSGLNISIRGGSSVNASNSPLYVIDGYPIDGNNVSSSVGLGNSTTSPLQGINPSDIESMEILKDASATAIYGSRGANGVVIITTKSGKKGAPKVSFESNFGVSKISKYVDVLEGQDFINYYNTLLRPPNGPPPAIGDVGWQSYRDTSAPYSYGTLPISELKLHNWQKEVFRTTIVTDNKLTISGGNDFTKYYTGIGVTRSNGILLNSDYTRYSANFKIDQKINNKLKTGLSLSTAHIIDNGLVSSTNNSGRTSGVVNSVVLFRPIDPKYLYEDADVNADGEIITERQNEIVNPLIRARGEKQSRKSFQTFANAFIEYEPIKNLKFLSRIGVNYNITKGRAWYPAEFGWGKLKGGGIAILNERQNTGWVNENTVSYNTVIANKHTIQALAGFTAQKDYYEYFQLEGEGFQIPGVNIDNIGSAPIRDPNLNRSDANNIGLQSVLGRINYSYDGKYYITASIRSDGSSKFAPGNKWGTFPSAALAWNVDNEAFFKKALPAVSTFKIRTSYGLTGNQGIPPFQSQATLSTLTYQFGSAIVTGLASARLPNELLTWEKTRQFDVGLEIGILNDRFNLTVDYYKKNTFDLLLAKPVSYVSGFESAFYNIGSMKNKGYEFSLNTINIRKTDFTWRSNFNISFNKNEVGDLGIGGADKFFVSGIPYDGSYSGYLNDYIVQTGSPVGSIYGWKWSGVFQYGDFTQFDGLTSDQSATLYNQMVNAGTPFTLKSGIANYKGNSPRPGYIKFQDINGPDGKPDGVVDDNDRSIIGDPNPKHFGGFSNTFDYKGFSLDILFTWSYGNDIYNKNKIDGLNADVAFRNQLGLMREAWTAENPSTTMYAIKGRSDGAGNRTSTFFIEDGSYLRLQNISLSYNLNKQVIKKMKISNFRVFVSLNNLHVWTKYSGFDPEVSVGNNALTKGIDFASYPRSKNARIGFNVTF